MSKCKAEYCFGIIPLKRDKQDWEVLLVKHMKGHFWSFPKGHIGNGENPTHVAERELKEETGLHVGHYLPLCPVMEEYQFTRSEQPIHKTAAYFLAEVYSGKIELKKDEVEEAVWIPLAEAHTRITFSASKQVCAQVIKLLKTLSENQI